MRAAGGRGILLSRQSARVGGRTCNSGRQGRADAARQLRPDRLDHLDGAKLDGEGSVSVRCPLPSRGIRAAQATTLGPANATAAQAVPISTFEREYRGKKC